MSQRQKGRIRRWRSILKYKKHKLPSARTEIGVNYSPTSELDRIMFGDYRVSSLVRLPSSSHSFAEISTPFLQFPSTFKGQGFKDG